MTNSPIGPDGSGSTSGITLPEQVWQLLIAASTAAVLAVSVYCLVHGITIIFMHLFYFPIILLAYHYRYRGFLLALLLSLVYVWLVYFFHGGEIDVITGAWLRFLVFAGIAAVVAYLSEHLSEDKKALQESEQQFRGVAERSSDVILLTDITGRATYVSPSVKRILGWNPREITGKLPGEFIHPDDISLVLDAVPDLGQGKTLEQLSIRFKRKDGEYATMEFSGAPVIKDGEIAGIQVIGRDITERQRMENELRDANRRLTDIIDFLPDPTMVIDAGGKVMAWNRAMVKLTGISVDSILGKGNYAYAVWFYGKPRPVLIDLVLRDDQDTIATMYPRYRRHERTILAEVETARPDGTRLDFWLTATPLFNQKGEIVGAIESLRDITHQKTIARALRESKNYLDAIINTISDPVFVKDHRFRFVTLNEGFCRFVGHTREELLGKTDYDFFPKEEAAIYRKNDEGVFLSQGINENEETLTDASGNRHTIVTKKSLYVNGDGEGFIVGIIRDISERKQMETALRIVNKKLNLLSSITRHDINNQLFSLKAFLGLSKESLEDAKQTQEYLLKAERAASAIERQIAFTKEYQDLGVNAPVWQSVRDCIKNAVMTLPVQDVHVLDKTGDLVVFADPLFEKVFYNLIDNALRYGGSKMTEVRISAAELDTGLMIVVEDDGAGIASDDKKQLFQRGFGHNTGLGLFLSREILTITGITIAETGVPGKGARFEIMVPTGKYRFPGMA